MKEPKLTYALNSQGRLVFIDDVPNGRNCNCTCAGCGKELIARQGVKNQHHFAHEGGNVWECYDKTLHTLAEQIIKDSKQVYAPKYEGSYTYHDSELLSFVDVEVEQRNDYSDLQPDLVGVTKDDKRIHIEIRNTHKVDADKEKKLRDREQICMEIDVSKLSLNIEKLKEFLLTKDEERKWVSHPEFEGEERKAKEDVFKYESAERDDSSYEITDREAKDWMKRMSELAARTNLYGFDEDERYNEKPTRPSLQKTQSEETSIPPKVIEKPVINHNSDLAPIIAKLRKERVIKDNMGNILHVEYCEQTYSGKYIIARVFDSDFATSRYPAHTVLINSQGHIVQDFKKESGASLFSSSYNFARSKF